MEKLTNNFHNTSIRVRNATHTLSLLGQDSAELTPAERKHVKRVRDTLCGANDCTCGVVR